MSVLEQMEQLREAEAAAERKAEDEKKERDRRWGNKFRTEEDEIKGQQLPLLNELRALGIADMIEEVTGKGSLRLSIEERDKDQQDHTLTEEDLELLRRFRSPLVEQTDWRVFIATPVLSENLVWDPTLVIEVRRKNYRHNHMSVREYIERQPWAIVRYTKDKELTITGEEDYFSGKVSKEQDVDKEAVEIALAKALLHPKRPEIQNRSPLSLEPIFGTP